MYYRSSRASLIVSLAAAATVIAIGWRSAGSLEILWDEKVDLDIATALRDHPLTGEQPTLDASQMRLPMYVNAIALALTGRDDLALSRAVSLAVAALTVIGAAVLGRLLFGPLVGGLAAVLLALSPYFLSFSRIAMTEGDVFLACSLTWAVWSFVRYQQRPGPGRWTLCAVLIALALGSKLFAVVLIVAFGVLTAKTTFGRDPQQFPQASSLKPLSRDPQGSASPRQTIRRLHRLLILGVAVWAASGLMALWSEKAAIVGWVALVGVWAATILHVLRSRALPPGRWARLLGMLALAVITFGALMPVHLIEADFGLDLARRIAGRGDFGPSIGLMDRFRLYLGILLIKLTVPWGVVSCLGLAFAGLRAVSASSKEDEGWRVCGVVVGLYLLLLCCLPLRQTFYLMGVYPLVVITTAAFLIQAARWHRKWSRRHAAGVTAAWTIGVAGLLVNLGVTTYSTYPYYHLYGLETVGERWLGAESRGYRNLIQTPSDGVVSLIRWCNTDPRVHPGDRVVSYLWEDAIIEDSLSPDRRYVFVPRGLRPDRHDVPQPPSIEDADFVLLHVNNLLGYGDRPPDWPSAALLAARFQVVHTVRRGPMDVAWVYGRR